LIFLLLLLGGSAVTARVELANVRTEGNSAQSAAPIWSKSAKEQGSQALEQLKLKSKSAAQEGTTQGDSKARTKKSKPKEPEPKKPSPSFSLPTLLPYITEGSIAALFGVALGVSTRAFMRLILGVLGLSFLVIQFFAYKGIITVDWGQLTLWFQEFVINLKGQDLGLEEILKHKLPAAGSLGLGYFLGFKKG